MALGVEPVAVIAVGANATGIIAIGQLATGVIAIGQLARGVIVVGQLGVGVVSVGQLAVGSGWAAGMLSIGTTTGPGMVALGLFGRLHLLRVLGRRSGPAFDKRSGMSVAGLVFRGVLAVALVVLWWVACGQPLLDAIVRPGGIFISPPHVYR